MLPPQPLAMADAADMRQLTSTIRELGRIAATHELHAAGFSRRALAAAVQQRSIIRVRQGWYSLPDIPPTLLRAARVGGRAGCITGAALHGMWLPPDDHLHVSVEHGDCRLRTPGNMRTRLAGASQPGVTTHWRPEPATGSRLLLSPIACLEEVIRCQPLELAVAIADSALHQPAPWIPAVVTRDDWRAMIDRMPNRSPLLAGADGLCETGTESLTRFRLARFRLPLVPQVRIDGKRVDFLVGSKLVVEVDGVEYHIDPVRFEADRTRDAELSVLGFRVLRFSYKQVIYRWAEVEASILAAVFRGDHH